MRIALALLCFCVMMTAAALAASQDRRVALVIGNSDYRAGGKLPNAKRDAVIFAETLRELGFSEVVEAPELDGAAMLRTLRDFATKAEKADWAVIYFAGHGIELGGANYLIPTDARLVSDRDVQFEAVALEQLIASLEGARKLRLVILDACRDNPFAARMTRTLTTRSIGRGLARVEPEGGTLVAYAAKAGQVAFDGHGENSPFLTSLRDRIRQPGVEINMVFRAVRDDVLAATGRRQEPFIYGSLPSEPFYFRPAEPQRATLDNPPPAAGLPVVPVPPTQPGSAFRAPEQTRPEVKSTNAKAAKPSAAPRPQGVMRARVEPGRGAKPATRARPGKCFAFAGRTHCE